jgi:hypothetical protein
MYFIGLGLKEGNIRMIKDYFFSNAHQTHASPLIIDKPKYGSHVSILKDPLGAWRVTCH